MLATAKPNPTTSSSASRESRTRHVYEAVAPDGRTVEVKVEQGQDKEHARAKGARKLGVGVEETLVRYSRTRH